MKKQYFLVLDTETATVPFINDYPATDKERKNIAIAKPLVYDIGWMIIDRKGVIIETANYLVQETFFVPAVFNTAYYREKRPRYMAMYNGKQIESANWKTIIEKLADAMQKVDYIAAANACFDFKKAIPFTHRYIKALYSENYQAWEDSQRNSIKAILNGAECPKNDEYMIPTFSINGISRPIIDIWGLACKRLIDTNKYRNWAIQNRRLSPSGLYFSTTVETVVQYLHNDRKYIESHTALDDARDEAEILVKCLKRGKAEPHLEAFPFRQLGGTVDFAKKTSERNKEIMIEFLEKYARQLEQDKKDNTRFYTQILNKIEELKN